MLRGLSLLCLTALTACYPDFQFGGSGGGGAGSGGNPTSSRAVGSTTSGMGGAGNGGDGGNGDGGQVVVTNGGSSSEGGAGGAPSTSTSTSTTGGAQPLPCGDGNGMIADCANATDACCLNLQSQSGDVCQATDDCGSDFYTLACQSPSDCAGQLCCAQFDDFLEEFLGVVECAASCPDPSRRMCVDALEDCEAGEVCTQLFSDDFAPEYADHYKYCH